MIKLNSYIKRITAKVLNACADLTERYAPQDITGLRQIDGIVQVRIEKGDNAWVLPFAPETFKAMVESFRLEVLAAIATEQRWQHRIRGSGVKAAIASEPWTVSLDGGNLKKKSLACLKTNYWLIFKTVINQQFNPSC